MNDAPTPAAPQFISDRPRAKRIVLDWPLRVGATEYRAISIVRLTAADVETYENALRSLSDGGRLRFPLYRDDDGALVPDAVLDALDDDDKLAIEEAAVDFLPRRFQAALERASTPPSGENTGQS